jgi:hypothetical protein
MDNVIRKIMVNISRTVVVNVSRRVMVIYLENYKKQTFHVAQIQTILHNVISGCLQVATVN